MGKHGQHRALVTAALLAATLLAVAAGGPVAGGPAAAPCRLALALALDVSSSVDAAEYRLQRDGLASALLAPEVAALILDAGAGPVAIAVFEWSGRNQQVLLAGWAEIGDRAALAALAARIAATERSHDNFPTALGNALGKAYPFHSGKDDMLCPSHRRSWCSVPL